LKLNAKILIQLTIFVAARKNQPLYQARIYSRQVHQLTLIENTLPQLVIACSGYFLNFDSAPAIRGHLRRAGAYAKAYKPFNTLELPEEPCFVFITPC
jgi:hypothetical protein